MISLIEEQIVTSKYKGLDQGAALAQLLDLIVSTRVKEHLEVVERYIGETPDKDGQNPEYRKQNLEIEFLGKVAKGPAAIDRISILLRNGVISIKQMQSIKVRFNKPGAPGKWAELGKNWKNMFDAKWSDEGITWSGKTYNSVNGNTKVDKKEQIKKREQQKEQWDDAIQKMTNDIVGLLEGEGIEDKLEKYFGRCPISPSISGRGDVFSAALDYTLGGTAASFGSKAIVSNMLKDVQKAQGGNRTERFFKNLSDSLDNDPPKAGKFKKWMAEKSLQAFKLSRNNPKTTAMLTGGAKLGLLAKKAPIIAAIAGGTYFATEPLIGEEKSQALGMYTFLHIFASQIPAGLTRAARLNWIVAATAAIGLAVKARSAEDNLACVIERALYGMCFGFSHTSFGPLVKMFRDKEFRTALRQGVKAKNFEKPTTLALTKMVKEALKVDQASKRSVKQIFDNIKTDEIDWGQEHINFLDEVITRAKKKGVDIKSPEKTFDLKELGLEDTFNSLEFKGSWGAQGQVPVKGLSEFGRKIFRENYLNPLNERAFDFSARIKALRDGLIKGTDDVVRQVDEKIKEIKELVEAADGRKIETQKIKDRIFPILKEVIEKSSKQTVEQIVKVKADIPKFITQAGDETGSILEKISITKSKIDPSRPVRFPVGASDELVDELVLSKGSEIYNTIQGKYLDYMGDLATQVADPKSGSQAFLEICETSLKDHPKKDVLLSKITEATKKSKTIIDDSFNKVADNFELAEDLMTQMDLVTVAVRNTISKGLGVSTDAGYLVRRSDQITNELLQEELERQAKVRKSEIADSLKVYLDSPEIKDKAKAAGKTVSVIAKETAKRAISGTNKAAEIARKAFSLLFSNTSRLGRRLAGTAFAAGATGIVAGQIRDDSFGTFWNEGNEEERKIKSLGAKIYFSALMNKIADNSLKLRPISAKNRNNDTTLITGLENLNDSTLTRVQKQDMDREIKNILGRDFIANNAFSDQSTLDTKLRPLVMEIIEEEQYYFSETKKLLKNKASQTNSIKSSLGAEARKHAQELLASGPIFDEHLKSRLAQITGDTDELLLSSNMNLSHVSMAKREFYNWPRLNDVPLRENDPRTWPIIAKYWEAIGSKNLAKKTLSGELYKKLGSMADEGPPWSSAFITYCMQYDAGFLKLLEGKTGGAHVQYYSPAMKNSLNIVKKIDNGEFTVGVDWVYLPVTLNMKADKYPALEKRHIKIRRMLPEKSIRYSQQPGDILLRDTISASGLHGDILVNSKDRIGGNLNDAVRIGKGTTRAILTKNPEAVKQLYRYAKLMVRTLKKGRINEQGVKTMEKKDLQSLVKEVLRENSGQGYAPYPYGSKVKEEEQPKEDYVEEWKSLSQDLIRDTSRDIAIEVAKILVKDLELFEDVLDLAGQNQSVGEEILRKVKEAREKAEDM